MPINIKNFMATPPGKLNTLNLINKKKSITLFEKTFKAKRFSTKKVFIV